MIEKMTTGGDPEKNKNSRRFHRWCLVGILDEKFSFDQVAEITAPGLPEMFAARGLGPVGFESERVEVVGHAVALRDVGGFTGAGHQREITEILFSRGEVGVERLEVFREVHGGTEVRT